MILGAPFSSLASDLDRNRPFSNEFHSKIIILSRLSLGQVGSFLGRLSHKGGRQKNVYVFSVYWFFLAPNSNTGWHDWGVAVFNQQGEGP